MRLPGGRVPLRGLLSPRAAKGGRPDRVLALLAVVRAGPADRAAAVTRWADGATRPRNQLHGGQKGESAVGSGDGLSPVGEDPESRGGRGLARGSTPATRRKEA